MSDEQKKRRGRPPLTEGSMTDVTLRMKQQTLDHVSAVLLPKAAEWPEFASSEPTRATILKIAIALGIKELEKRK
jgi:hypothetical protein